MNLTDKKVTEKKVQDYTKKVQGHHSLNHDFPVLYFYSVPYFYSMLYYYSALYLYSVKIVLCKLLKTPL